MEKLSAQQFKEVFINPEYFFIFTTGLEPYEWQIEFIANESQLETIRVSRQGGKTLCAAVKIVREALLYDNQFILIISPTKEQSGILFRIIKKMVEELRVLIPSIVKQSLQTRLQLFNGSWIYLAAGASVRGYSPTRLVFDEAAFIKEEFYISARPALAATHGKTTLISTPFGKKGYFYDSHTIIDSFYRLHIPWTKIPHLDKELIEVEKITSTDASFAQEYLAEFIETSDNYFTREEIQSSVSDVPQLGRSPTPEDLIHDKFDYFLGVDLARMGTDETALTVSRIPKSLNDSIEIVHIETTAKMPTTDAIGRIKSLHEIYNFKEIFIDESFVGGAVIDTLTIDNRLPVIPINFASKADTTVNDSKKEAMYKNLKWMLERNTEIAARNDESALILKIPLNHRLINQMSEMIYKYSTNGLLMISHPASGHDDLCDSLALSLYHTVGRKYMPLRSNLMLSPPMTIKELESHVRKPITWGDKLKYLKKGQGSYGKIGFG